MGGEIYDVTTGQYGLCFVVKGGIVILVSWEYMKIRGNIQVIIYRFLGKSQEGRGHWTGIYFSIQSFINTVPMIHNLFQLKKIEQLSYRICIKM